MVRKAKSKGFGMGVEFDLTYSVCYLVLLTHMSYYYDIVVFLATVMDSCLSESSVAYHCLHNQIKTP